MRCFDKNIEREFAQNKKKRTSMFAFFYYRIPLIVLSIITLGKFDREGGSFVRSRMFHKNLTVVIFFNNAF